MSVQSWNRIEPTIVTKIDYRHVVVKTFKVPGTDITKTFATFLHEGSRAAGVIALTPDNKVIVARQFRQGPERLMDEIPGGGVEDGEDPQLGAMRELREETGYVSDDVTLLGTAGRDAYTNGRWYYYLARNCRLSGAGQQLDEHELVDVQLITIQAFIDNAKHDRMTDPAAVLMAYDTLKVIQEGTDV